MSHMSGMSDMSDMPGVYIGIGIGKGIGIGVLGAVHITPAWSHSTRTTSWPMPWTRAW